MLKIFVVIGILSAVSFSSRSFSTDAPDSSSMAAYEIQNILDVLLEQQSHIRTDYKIMNFTTLNSSSVNQKYKENYLATLKDVRGEGGPDLVAGQPEKDPSCKSDCWLVPVFKEDKAVFLSKAKCKNYPTPAHRGIPSRDNYGCEMTAIVMPNS